MLSYRKARDREKCLFNCTKGRQLFCFFDSVERVEMHRIRFMGLQLMFNIRCIMVCVANLNHNSSADLLLSVFITIIMTLPVLSVLWCVRVFACQV